MNFIRNSIQNIYFFIIDIKDFIQRHFLILLLLFLLLAGSFVIVRTFFYFGTLTIHVNEKNTKIIIDGNPQYLNDASFTTCEENTCTLKLFPRTHQIFIQKDGFLTAEHTTTIQLQQQSEIFIQLKPNTTSITPTNWKPATGVFFPLKTSRISEKVQNFSIQNKDNKKNDYLFFKNTPLFPIVKNNPIVVSSDEVGRSVFIASTQNITRFDTKKKRTEPSLIPTQNKKIASFFPQNTGNYLFQYENNNTIYMKAVSQRVLYPFTHNETLSPTINHTCITSSNTIVFLAHNPQNIYMREPSLYTSEYFSFNNAIEKTVISQISLFDISHIECINDNTIIIYLKNKTAYTVTF